MRKDELVALAIFVLFWFGVYLTEFIFIVRFLFKKTFPKSKKAIAVHVLAVLGVLCLFYGYLIEPNWIDVHHVEIVTNKLVNTELTVVQISDMHCFAKARNEAKVTGFINGLNPDVVLFTGDAINTPAALPLFKKTMSVIKAGIGKFAVRGNFDDWYWRNVDLFGGTGFKDVGNRMEVLKKDNEIFTISGMNLRDRYKTPSFAGKIPRDKYNIFLVHYPGFNLDLADKGVDLFLSGHTHGGQVALPFYGAIITLAPYGKKYESGRYNIGNSVLYVNRGIGAEGLGLRGIRLFARPEITVFHIRPGKRGKS